MVGEGLQEVGKAASQTTDQLQQYATTVQNIYNKQAADTHGLDTAKAVDNLWQQWKVNNTQAQAVTNYPALQQQIEDLHSKGREGLSPLAAVDYDALSRRYINGTLSEAANYVAQQGHAGIVDTANANAMTAGQLFATSPTPENEASLHAQAGNSAAQFFAGAGLKPDDPQVHQKMLEYLSPAYSSLIKTTYDGGNLAGANALLDAHKNDLTTQAYTELAGTLRTANNANQVATAANVAVFGGTFNPGSSSNYVQAVHGREGTGQNPFSSAAGIGQFTGKIENGTGKGTWFDVLKGDPQFAQDIAGKTDAQILALRSDASVADRAIMSYGQQNAAILQHDGFASTSANVGLAHGYGPQGAVDILRANAANPNAPIESVIDPATARNNRVAGETVGQVVGAFTARFGSDDFTSSTASAAVSLPAIPPPAANDDPEKWMADAESRAASNAALMFPGNFARQQGVIAQADAVIRRTVAPVEANQHATYDAIDKWAVQNNVGSVTDLQTHDPGAWNSLPGKYQAALERTATSQGNLMTDVRLNNERGVNGALALASVNPDATTSLDIRSMDLTTSFKTQALKQQADIAGHVAGADKTVPQIMASQEGKSAIDSLGLGTTTHGAHTPAYYQFAGVLQEEVDTYRQANGNKNPPPADVSRMVAQATQKIGATSGIFGSGIGPDFGNAAGTPAFQVPSADHDQIRAALVARGNPNPSELDIGKWYATKLRSTGVLK